VSQQEQRSSEQSAPRAGSGEMFDGIAQRYDLLNRIISLGLDQSWRRKTVKALALSKGATVLDLATGTGDLAMMIAELHPEVHVLGTDPSKGMLEVADRKAQSAGSKVAFRSGDAQAIELADHSVDAISMAFGIRNVPDRPKALREMARVLRPGGRVAILELSEPARGSGEGVSLPGRAPSWAQGALSALARFHIHAIVPAVGGVISGKREYGYLQRSIAAFPPPERFAALMEEAGLEVLQIELLTFGVACLFVGTPKLATPEGALGEDYP
jgi:demethylmenaquinone methyltransferase/2-methoxy-6-polyprenyl-1,4-benzoquinol methylase